MGSNGKISDIVLLDVYWHGWYENMNGMNKSVYSQPLIKKAYELGWCDFIAGDDVSSVDQQSDEQILKRIKNESLTVIKSFSNDKEYTTEELEAIAKRSLHDGDWYWFTKEGLEDFKKSLAQSIVIGKLPEYIDLPTYDNGEVFESWYKLGINDMRSIVLSSIRTEAVVTKPYRDLLSNINCKLAMLEERIHGDDGDIITYIRGDINDILYRNKA